MSHFDSSLYFRSFYTFIRQPTTCFGQDSSARLKSTETKSNELKQEGDVLVTDIGNPDIHMTSGTAETQTVWFSLLCVLFSFSPTAGKLPLDSRGKKQCEQRELLA